MQIHQIYTHNDLRNFTYVLELSDRTAYVIDPWDADEVSSFIKVNQLSLRSVINTHEHWDHTKGNQKLVNDHDCEVWAHKNGKNKIPGFSRSLQAGEEIVLSGQQIMRVMDTPGHTFAHLCFVVQEKGKDFAVFTGDTLFNAGVGRCGGGGNEKVLYETISQQIQTLDDSVVIYPGHDYLENNLSFTLKVEPKNLPAQELLREVLDDGYFAGSIQTNIAIEKKINTFLRLSSEEIQSNLNLVNSDQENVFLALRKLRDKW